MLYRVFDHYKLGEIKVIGSRKTVFVLQEWVVRNGLSQTSDLFLSDVGGRLKVVARIETGLENEEKYPPKSDDELCWEYSATYEFVAGDNPLYDDIVVRTSRTRITDGELYPFEVTTGYGFLDGEYRVEGD